jgi:hypothetical protein
MLDCPFCGAAWSYVPIWHADEHISGDEFERWQAMFDAGGDFFPFRCLTCGEGAEEWKPATIEVVVSHGGWVATFSRFGA